MRAAVLFLISSLVVTSLTFDVSQMTNQNFLALSTTRQNLVPTGKKPQLHQPKYIASNRGSGRRYVMTYLLNG